MNVFKKKHKNTRQTFLREKRLKLFCPSAETCVTEGGKEGRKKGKWKERRRGEGVDLGGASLSPRLLLKTQRLKQRPGESRGINCLRSVYVAHTHTHTHTHTSSPLLPSLHLSDFAMPDRLLPLPSPPSSSRWCVPAECFWRVTQYRRGSVGKGGRPCLVQPSSTTLHDPPRRPSTTLHDPPPPFTLTQHYFSCWGVLQTDTQADRQTDSQTRARF